MQNHVMTQYQGFGPDFDNMTRGIEAMLQVYTGIAAVFAALILGVVLCLIIRELRETRVSKTRVSETVPRARPFGARELTDTGF
ncbi:MAG TPA: hypothetical protein VNH22_10235 [Blastocatellia bacterium]|jgi:hypothetical protein|nr:hypothetical protein [Blastocatellia bacterium]